jgi:uroporphyrinogen-III synthase
MLDAAARERLRHTPIVVVGRRQAEAARALGALSAPQMAHTASDAAILDAIKAWRASQKPL